MKKVPTFALLVFILCSGAALGQTREIRINLVDPAGAEIIEAAVRATSRKKR